MVLSKSSAGDALKEIDCESSTFIGDSMKCDEAGELCRENIFAISRGTKNR
jgi:hypothetical protein